MPRKKKFGKVTVFDIAEALNISAATVSRSLNDHPNISNKTKKKVFTMAKKMGYGMGLKYKESKSVRKLIALVIPTLDSSFYIEYAKYLQHYLDLFEYNLVIFSTNDNFQKEKKIAEQLTQFKLAGAIVSLSSKSEGAKSFKVLDEYNIPWVMFDQVDNGISKISITTDNISASKRAVSHLIGNKFTRVALLAGHPNSSKFSEIVKGYKLALLENSIAYNNDFLIYSDLTKEDVEESLHRLLTLDVTPNAILVSSSDATVEVLQFLKNNSIQIPKDIAIVSYGFDKALKYVSPSVSHVQIAEKQLAQKTSDVLISLIRKEKLQESSFELAAKFIIRKSSLNIHIKNN
jgi:LacI family transcriptional regulator